MNFGKKATRLFHVPSVDEAERDRDCRALVKMLDKDPGNYEAEKALCRVGDASAAELVIKQIAHYAKAQGEAEGRAEAKQAQATAALRPGLGPYKSVLVFGPDVAAAEHKEVEDCSQHLFPFVRALSCISTADHIRAAAARPDLDNVWVRRNLELAAVSASRREEREAAAETS